jgi:hypothetical protein
VPTANEVAGNQSGQQAALDAGIEQISAQGRVEFQLYTKLVLSEDGSVFWVAATQTMIASGSLHYATDRQQNIDETVAVNHVLLTSEQAITELNEIAPGTMWVGSWPLAPNHSLQIAFSQRGNFFDQAQVWHYSGVAVLPAMQSQLIAQAEDIPAGPIVSNSLPIWLLQGVFGEFQAPVYPSFAVPDNIVPPYVVAHIEPSRTETFGNMPFYVWPGTPAPTPPTYIAPFYDVAATMLCRDEVDLILYGFTNAMAWQFLSNLISYSMIGPGETPTFGFANAPAIQDEKRPQVEIAALAQKKSIHISANYYQGAANAAAYRLILQALIPTLTIGTP